MAVVKYSGLIDQLRGRLNGTVFSKFHAGFNAYKKGQPKDYTSAAQLIRRAQLQTASQEWAELSPAQREIWKEIAANTPVKNRLGDDIALPAFNYFVKYYLESTYANAVFNANPSTSLEKPPIFQIIVLEIETRQQETGYEVMFPNIYLQSSSGTTFPLTFKVEISNPVSQTTAYDKTNVYIAGYYRAIGPWAPNQIIPIGGIWHTMPPGWHSYENPYFWVTITAFYFDTAQQNTPVMASASATFSPPAPPVWEPVFSVYDQFYVSADISGQTGGNWQFIRASLGLQSSESLTPPPANYAVEIQMADTTQANSTPNPAAITGTEYLWQGDLVSIFNTGNDRFNAISQPNLITALNTQWLWPDSSYQQWKTFRIRLQDKTTGIWSDWQYFTFKAEFI